MNPLIYSDPVRVRRDVARILRPPNRSPLSATAAKLLHVERGGSMVPWDPSLVPYMHEPMNCLKSRKYTSVIFTGPARTAKTVSLVDGWVCDTIVNNPGDFLLVQISQDKASEHSRKRLNREFNASPDIVAALSPRAHDNNVHDKLLKSGNFLKIGWPSKNIFASSDWKYVAITDYDRIPLDIDGEGSAFILASKRTQTFMSSGMTLAEGSPGHYITDPDYRLESPHMAPPSPGIMSLYNQGDRRLFYWQCPECGEWFEPDFKLLIWDKDQPDPALASKDVEIVCPHCGSSFNEFERKRGESALKLRLNDSGIWVPDGCHLDQNGILHGERRDTRIASFWQKGPTAAFQTWNELVYKYLAGKDEFEKTGNLHDLQTTVNVDQGWPFTPPRENARDSATMIARKQPLAWRMVPEQTRFLVATIDVQAGAKTARFEVAVFAVFKELQIQVIDRFAIQKSKRVDPDNPEKFVRIDPAAYIEDWDLITEKVIQRSYELDDGSGRRLPIHMTACDSGGADGVTDNAYQYYRKLKKGGLARKFMLVKGQGRGDVIKESFPDNSARKDRKASARGDIPVYQLNTDKIKDTVAHSLSREEPGPRYVNFPESLADHYFDELTAEQRNSNGHWEKHGSRRNEMFDLFVYLWAVIYKLAADRIDWDSPPYWAVPLNEQSELITAGGDTTAPPPRRRRRR